MKKKRVVLFSFAVVLIMAAAVMTGCKTTPPPETEFPSGFIGEWKRELPSAYKNTLTFSTKTLKDSNQGQNWRLINISGDSYTIVYATDPNWFATIFVKLNNGKLEIKYDHGTGEDNWNGTWIKL